MVDVEKSVHQIKLEMKEQGDVGKELTSYFVNTNWIKSNK